MKKTLTLFEALFATYKKLPAGSTLREVGALPVETKGEVWIGVSAPLDGLTWYADILFES